MALRRSCATDDRALVFRRGRKMSAARHLKILADFGLVLTRDTSKAGTSRRKESPLLRVGIDVGGTFTDLFAWDMSTNATRSAKTLTTRDDLTRGVLNALAEANVELAEVATFVHGSTIATNALIERSFRSRR